MDESRRLGNITISFLISIRIAFNYQCVFHSRWIYISVSLLQIHQTSNSSEKYSIKSQNNYKANKTHKQKTNLIHFINNVLRWKRFLRLSFLQQSQAIEKATQLAAFIRILRWLLRWWTWLGVWLLSTA